MNNSIVIKGKKDRLEIKLDPDLDFLILSENLVEKIKEVRDFVGKTNMAIQFVGRLLTDEEENSLISIISANSEMIIKYVFSEKKAKDKEILDLPKTLAQEGKTLFHRGTLRSGAKLESEGNIVIIGDVNPGSIVRAKGNVLVLGHLNGTVYAGLGGDINSFIGAMFFNPIQITIVSEVIDNIQKEILDSNRVNKKSKFKFACIKNEKLVIEEWV